MDNCLCSLYGAVGRRTKVPYVYMHGPYNTPVRVRWSRKFYVWHSAVAVAIRSRLCMDHVKHSRVENRNRVAAVWESVKAIIECVVCGVRTTHPREFLQLLFIRPRMPLLLSCCVPLFINCVVINLQNTAEIYSAHNDKVKCILSISLHPRAASIAYTQRNIKLRNKRRKK